MNVLKNILTLHAKRYPSMELRDYVKLLYQSEFGPGHLVEAENALEALQREFAQAQEEGYTPEYAVEAIGDGLCRVHLDPRFITGEDLPLLARCFAHSACPRGSEAGLWKKLGLLSGLAWAGTLPLEPQELDLFLALYESGGCPPIHHSDGYRELYRPHYRVMDRDLSLYAPALRAVDALLRNTQGPVIVAVDGRCASGKTTFAQKAEALFDECNVFHMDDFFLPPEKRMQERLSTPGGNVDYERSATELFEPLRREEAVAHRRFDCSTMTMGEPQGIPFRRLNIVEGSYALHPVLSGYSQLRIFFTCSPEVQLARLSRRETPESLERFRKRWIPMEENYFRSLSIQDRCDIVVDTSPLSSLEPEK